MAQFEEKTHQLGHTLSFWDMLFQTSGIIVNLVAFCRIVKHHDCELLLDKSKEM